MVSVSASLAYGIIAGLGIAMPLGAIGVLILRTGMTRGFRVGAAAGLGAATVDLTYCALAFAAGAGLAGTIESWGSAPLWASGAVILAIGAYQLVGTFRGGPAEQPAPPRARSLYLRFVALTALNPVTVLYFVALAGALASRHADAASRAAFVVGTGVASAAWQLGLAAAGAVLHRAAGPRVSHVLGVVGSVIVVGLGAALIVRAATG